MAILTAATAANLWMKHLIVSGDKMIRALLFDINGTVTDILTNEADDDAYRVTANYLSYYGVDISPAALKESYFDLNRQQRKMSPEEYPEFDSGAIFSEIIAKHRTRTAPTKLLSEQ